MKITEVTNEDTVQNLPFDLVDDVIIFMKNDSVFYRKKYYPALVNFQKDYNKKKKADCEKHFGAVVDSAMNTYCKKFQLAKKMSDVFCKDDRKEILNKISQEEIEEMQK